MSFYDLSDRDRLLLDARVVNGVKVHVEGEHERQAMQEMVNEGLFYYSDTMFSEGYWWTDAGERAAEEAWQRAPVERLETRYRDHRSVSIELNGNKEEVCHVNGLWVREFLGHWLVDHPNGRENVRFNSADEAIEWALEAVGAR